MTFRSFRGATVAVAGVAVLVAGGCARDAARSSEPAPPPPAEATASAGEPAPPPPVEIDPDRAREEARNAGLLGSTIETEGGVFASLTSADDGIEGGMLGGTSGTADAGDGLGAAGGSGEGTIGTGRYDTLGHGAGTSGGDGARRAAPVPAMSLGTPTVNGSLDKAIVRRYLKRVGPRLKYCYEKALLAQPALQGTVSAAFTIAADGKVASSTATGIDAAIGSCVGDVVRAIEFPRPPDGAPVDVRFGLTFTYGGG